MALGMVWRDKIQSISQASKQKDQGIGESGNQGIKESRNQGIEQKTHKVYCSSWRCILHNRPTVLSAGELGPIVVLVQDTHDHGGLGLKVEYDVRTEPRTSLLAVFL